MGKLALPKMSRHKSMHYHDNHHSSEATFKQLRTSFGVTFYGFNFTEFIDPTSFGVQIQDVPI